MRNLLILMLLCSTTTFLAQEVMVIHIDGEAFSVEEDNGKVAYEKLFLGDLAPAAQILVKAGSKVRLLSGTSSYVDLTGEATYDLADMVFEPAEDKGMFAKFCKYFKDFFAGHTSAEAKASYRNSIYAVSRGSESVPSLDYPLAGTLPYVAGPMTFSWTHACDDCKYVFQIMDYTTRSSVFAQTTTAHHVVLDTMQEYLQPNTRYYWLVTISGQDLEYAKTIFTTSEQGDYANEVAQSIQFLEQLNIDLGAGSRLVYTLQDLYDKDLINYAIYYGTQQVEQHEDKKQLQYLVDQFWYSRLQ